MPNGAQTENSDENARPSDSHRSTPLSIKSSDKVAPPEYKLSGMWLSLVSIRYTVIQLPTSKAAKPIPMRYSRRRQRFLSSGISLPLQSRRFNFYGPGN